LENLMSETTSNHPDAHGHGHQDEHHDDDHGMAHTASVKVLLGTGGALMVLTVITVLATKIDLGGNINLALAMAIAAIKATLVVLFFMHLKYDKVFHSVLFVGGVLAAALFVGFALMDSGQYQETIQWDTNNPIAAPIGPRPIVK
jgi:cytochrome c oxidase subunit IV